MKNRNILKSIFLIAVIFFVLTGCSSIKPITQNIINDAGGNTEIEKFQYYVSTKLVLRKSEQTRNQQNVTKTGTATITDVVYNDRIIILKNTMGVVLRSLRDENDILTLEVCFEEDDNKIITFKQDGAGSEKKFYIIYQDPFTRRINYGGEQYIVDFSGDRPYLMIKIDKQLKQMTKTKWASGRRVQN
jgi:predicted nucleic acid-binding protein